jgi:von Willebrand factor type A domain
MDTCGHCTRNTGPEDRVRLGAQIMRRWVLPLSLLWFTAGCGRTEPVRFPQVAVDAGVDGGTPCIPGVVTLTRARATVMFVLDRSGSMSSQFGATTRWQALTDGLAQSLPSVDQTTAIGAYIFPSGGLNAGCGVSGAADLAPATGNVSRLLALMNRSSPSGGTPTAPALDRAAAAVRSVRAATSARALVLATDGAPGCNSQLDPLTCICTSTQSCFQNVDNCLDDTRTLQELSVITASGLPTWVIGIQDATDSVLIDVLNRMAVAGGRPRIGTPRFYPATSPGELEAALATIRDQVGGCTFLTVSVPDAQGNIRVLLDGSLIPEDPTRTDGWSWADRGNGELVFSGAACALAAQGTAVVTANVGCSDTSGPDAGAP